MNKNSRIAITALCLAGLYTSARAQPLADFDALVARCTQAFEQRPMTQVAYAEAAQTWVKRVYAPATIRYRVHKTGSRVSPFVGQIEITEVAAAQRGDDEDMARVLEVSMDENVIRSVRRINFAYQESTWTVMGATVVTEVKRDASDEFSAADKTKLSREAVLQSTGPVSTCVDAHRY